MIYADNAATTKTSPAAIRAMTDCMALTYGNPSSLHSLGRQARQIMDDARGKIARCIGCTAKELIFTSGGTEADNQAILTAAHMGKRLGRKHIVSTAFEHHAVLNTLYRLQNEGFSLTLLDMPESGVINAQQVADAIREDTCLVTILFANNEIGTVQPISEIGAICREKQVIFHTDAVQAVGHIPVDVQKQCIDMLSLSAHKFCGPKGIGALYVRSGIEPHSLITGGAQERGRRAGTENLPAIAAMAAALEDSCKRMAEDAARLEFLRERLICGLAEIPYSILNGDRAARLPGIVNFSFEGIEGEALLMLLDDNGICASTGSACDTGSLDPSHVLLAIGRQPDIAYGSIRLSIDTELNESDIDCIIACTRKAVERLRASSQLWREISLGRKNHAISERCL